MIEIRSITKKFDSFTAVNNVKLEISPSTFFGLLGPNGAGKTTLIRMMLGLSRPLEGEIIIKGMKMNRSNDRLKRIIGVMPQHTNLDKELTVRENLIFGARLFGMEKNYRSSRIDELLKFIDLKEFEGRMAKNLSGGMQRRLMLAKALLNDPELLFLDEPTVGVDVNARRKLWDVLKTMKDRGKTILMTTHYIEEAEQLCEEVALMDKGEIFIIDTPERLISSLGRYTVEYFTRDNRTEYMYFSDKDGAKQYAHGLNGSFTLRETNLEDVFFDYTCRRVH